MEEDRFIPLSYISQYNYCKRRVGLLMLEQQWNDSTDTVKGTIEHKNVHSASVSTRDNIIVFSDLSVVSHSMNLFGKCDAVEAVKSDEGHELQWVGNERYVLYPVEYKHGSLRNEPEYEYQLCAQAMCMEEMFNCKIGSGAVFYISSHRRQNIIFTDKHRDIVKKTALELSDMIISQKVPDAEYCTKCMKCSMKDICMPELSKSVKNYLSNIKSKELKGELF